MSRLLLLPFWPAAFLAASPAPAPRDAVALEQLPDAEITVRLEDVPIESALRMVAKLARVPLVLNFEPDPTLKVTVNARNVSSRAFLQSLADTYGLEYEGSAAGVVVRRRGMPSATKPVTIGAWSQGGHERPPSPGAPAAGPLYQLRIEMRRADGTRIGPGGSAFRSVRPADRPGDFVMPARWLQTLSMSSVSWSGGRRGEVTVFDHHLLSAEPHEVSGRVELNFCINQETSAGLELLGEVVTSKPLDGRSYVEEHTLLSKTAGPGETVLFAMEDGRQIVLARWARRQN